MTWFPTYLLEYRHLALKTVGTLASLPLLAGMVGDIVGGTLTDAVYRKTGKLKFARRVVAAPAMLASSACLIPATMAHSAWTAILCLTASLFFLELVEALRGPFLWTSEVHTAARCRCDEHGGQFSRVRISNCLRGPPAARIVDHPILYLCPRPSHRCADLGIPH